VIITSIYKGILFAERLHAQWAAYLDLAGIHWEYLGEDNFQVFLECVHTECCFDRSKPIEHILNVTIVPYADSEQVQEHYNRLFSSNHYDDPSPAVFGATPLTVYWIMLHGAGGGAHTELGWGEASGSHKSLLDHWKKAYEKVEFGISEVK